MKLTVIIPTYNEINSLEELINVILKINFIKIQIILVDDCSNDGTKELIKLKLLDKIDKVIFHEKNLGKGASIKSAQPFVNGDIVLIQDADLEYDPNDYHKLINPIDKGVADVVYGSRFIGSEEKRVLMFWHTVGNKILTFLSNMFTNLNLTDMENCYKVFRSEIIKKN